MVVSVEGVYNIDIYIYSYSINFKHLILRVLILDRIFHHFSKFIIRFWTLISSQNLSLTFPAFSKSSFDSRKWRSHQQPWEITKRKPSKKVTNSVEEPDWRNYPPRNISLPRALLKTSFLFPRWDVLVPWILVCQLVLNPDMKSKTSRFRRQLLIVYAVLAALSLVSLPGEFTCKSWMASHRPRFLLNITSSWWLPELVFVFCNYDPNWLGAKGKNAYNIA